MANFEIKISQSGGDNTMRSKFEIDKLGSVIKSARLARHMTHEQLAKKLDISLRHLKAIENENQKPSYELLFAIIRELEIPADTIFYPELGYDRFELEKLRLLLSQCDKKEVSLVTATVQALLNEKERESCLE
jgi:transcriptional regulator with XRE-family HTH domain